MSDDLIQRAREAMVAVLDTNAAIVARTGRASGNLIDIEDGGEESPLPILLYEFQSDEPGPILGSRALHWQFHAAALSQGAANELVALVEPALTYGALAALATPLDAYVERAERVAADTDRLQGVFLAALDLTLIA